MVKVLACTCGHQPTFVSTRVAEDAVESQFVCQRGNAIPGGGFMGGCGKQGPVIEDAYSDHDTAASNWNAMIRREKVNV